MTKNNVSRRICKLVLCVFQSVLSKSVTALTGLDSMSQRKILLQASNCNLISENVVQYTWCLIGESNEIISACISEERSIVCKQVVFHNLANGCFCFF